MISSPNSHQVRLVHPDEVTRVRCLRCPRFPAATEGALPSTITIEGQDVRIHITSSGSYIDGASLYSSITKMCGVSSSPRMAVTSLAEVMTSTRGYFARG